MTPPRKTVETDDQAVAQADREAQAAENKPELYDDGKTLDQLSDARVLDLVGLGGPGVHGQALYDRAQAIRKQRADAIVNAVNAEEARQIRSST